MLALEKLICFFIPIIGKMSYTQQFIRMCACKRVKICKELDLNLFNLSVAAETVLGQTFWWRP